MLEADSIAHAVYKPGSQAVKDVVNRFGAEVLVRDKPEGEEEINRKELGRIVFSDPTAMSVSHAMHHRCRFAFLSCQSPLTQVSIVTT